MKIVGKHIDKRRKGRVTVIPEDLEDFWFLYNIIKVGDKVKMKVNRKIQNESTTGLVKNTKKYVLTILEILDINFTYDNSGTSLFMKTKNVGQNEYINIGQLQTALISLFYPITICMPIACLTSF